MQQPQFIQGPYVQKPRDTHTTYHVLNWNILGKDLAVGFPRVDEEVLAWETRFPLIVGYIRDSGADVVTLQEASEDILEALRDVYGHTPFNVSRDVILWKKSKFSLSELLIEKYTPTTKTQRITMATLQFNDRDETLLVATTHFKAGRENEYVRRTQADKLLSRVERYQGTATYAVVCTDLNDDRDSEAYKLLTRDQILLDIYTPWSNKWGAEELVPPKHTTFKYRVVEGEVARCSDYIFMMMCTGAVLGMEASKVDDLATTYAATGLPARDMPSDHVPLHAKFRCAPDLSGLSDSE